MNTQDWSPSEWPGWISLQSRLPLNYWKWVEWKLTGHRGVSQRSSCTQAGEAGATWTAGPCPAGTTMDAFTGTLAACQAPLLAFHTHHGMPPYHGSAREEYPCSRKEEYRARGVKITHRANGWARIQVHVHEWIWKLLGFQMKQLQAGQYKGQACISGGLLW